MIVNDGQWWSMMIMIVNDDNDDNDDNDSQW